MKQTQVIFSCFVTIIQLKQLDRFSNEVKNRNYYIPNLKEFFKNLSFLMEIVSAELWFTNQNSQKTIDKTVWNLNDSISQKQSQIVDICEALLINLATLKLLSSSNYRNPLENSKNKSVAENIETKVSQIQKQIQIRKSKFSNYFILKQVSNQNLQTRQERLKQYQHRIYELKRSVQQKQSVLQNLLRPIQRSSVRQNSLSTSNKQSEKYRFLLQQIDAAQGFKQQIESFHTNGFSGNNFLSEKTNNPLKLPLLPKKEPILRRQNITSLNQSLVSNSSSQKQNNEEQLQCPNSKRLDIYSQRSFKVIRLQKKMYFDQIEKLHNQKQINKKFDTYPLPYDYQQNKITISQMEQSKKDSQKLKRIKQLQEKIASKKIQNAQKLKILGQLTNQNNILTGIVHSFKSNYMSLSSDKFIEKS